MALDKAELQQIDDIKNREKKLAEDAMYETMSKFSSNAQSPDEDNAEGNILSNVEESEKSTSTKGTQPKLTRTLIRTRSVNFKEESQTPAPAPVPAPAPAQSSVRAPAIIKFKHTHRAFKTPMRESTLLREQAFLAKNRPYLKANHYFNTESLSSSNIENSDPTWLTRKGDGFYEAGDYLSAINAYSTILDNDSTYIQAYDVRSKCYFIIEEPGLCIHDCMNFIRIMDETDTNMNINTDTSNNCNPTNQDLESTKVRAKILVRMSAAHSQFDTLHHYKLSLSHLQNASKVDPDDNSIKPGIEKLIGVIKAHEHKHDADLAFERNELDSAIDLYTKAISSDDNTFLKAYSNRSAVYLLSGKHQNCVNDCSYILDELRKKNTVPLPGSEARVHLVEVCLRRRAVAYQKLNELDRASKDNMLVTKYFGDACIEAT